MRAGGMRDRLELQEPVSSIDSFGQEVDDWATIATFWARVRPIKGQELLSVRQQQAQLTHVVTFRFQGSNVRPLPTMRFRNSRSGRILHIESVVNVNERNAMYECQCVERIESPQP